MDPSCCVLAAVLVSGGFLLLTDLRVIGLRPYSALQIAFAI
jgi:hypothetical protein